MKYILFFITFVLLTACTEKQSDGIDANAVQGAPVVIASNYPLYFFTQKIAGDVIDVRFPEIDGDPAMWAPGGQQSADLQKADLLILNGAGYESWLAFTTLPGGQLLDTTTNVQAMLLPIENEAIHQHGPAGKHSHEGTAFTTWLDPQLAIEQARSIMQGLSQLEPKQAGLFNTNFEELKLQLGQLDQSLAQAFSRLGDQPIIFSHPVYQYLQHRYRINGRSMHWEPEVEPGTKEWIGFGNLLREHPATLMLWEASPIDSVKNKLEQLGVVSMEFNPAGNLPDQGNYFSVMNQNVIRLNLLLSEASEQTK
ncbi:MAG: metal ABC transporter substrate-binding protein [Xanthomonadales bacterium]|nr:metal ABC transporter substrate-binding protein [Xanthomonadales bacterium]